MSPQSEEYFSHTLPFLPRNTIKCKTELWIQSTINILCKQRNMHKNTAWKYTCVPWVSERCREFSASKPSQEMMRRDTKMRREEGEEKNGQKARDKNATLVHLITHTNRHIMLSGNQHFPYLHSRQFISVCIVGPPSALSADSYTFQYLRFPSFYTVSVHSCTVLTHQSWVYRNHFPWL
jgi:hypothetical protein